MKTLIWHETACGGFEANDDVNITFQHVSVYYQVFRLVTPEFQKRFFVSIYFPDKKVNMEVSSFESGKRICENYRRNFWKDLLDAIHFQIGADEDEQLKGEIYA